MSWLDEVDNCPDSYKDVLRLAEKMAEALDRVDAIQGESRVLMYWCSVCSTRVHIYTDEHGFADGLICPICAEDGDELMSEVDVLAALGQIPLDSFDKATFKAWQTQQRQKRFENVLEALKKP